jgi:hypothetical protein
MLLKIIQFITKLFYKPKILVPSKEQLLSLEDDYACEINFKVTYDQNIDIEFIHPSVQESSIEDISLLAETCANLVVLLNNGLFKKDILTLIKNRKKQHMNNEKNTLLLDNILFFSNLLQDELKNAKTANSPLVRPSAAFKLSN